MCHGANPGLVESFAKEALLEIAKAEGIHTEVPTTRKEWAALANKLQIKVS